MLISLEQTRAVTLHESPKVLNGELVVGRLPAVNKHLPSEPLAAMATHGKMHHLKAMSEAAGDAFNSSETSKKSEGALQKGHCFPASVVQLGEAVSFSLCEKQGLPTQRLGQSHHPLASQTMRAMHVDYQSIRQEQFAIFEYSFR